LPTKWATGIESKIVSKVQELVNELDSRVQDTLCALKAEG
jgi:hypothetical protein